MSSQFDSHDDMSFSSKSTTFDSKNKYVEDGLSNFTGGNDDPGIKKIIGEGEDAKNSVVWHVITYSLTIYSCVVSSLLVIDVLKTGGDNGLLIVKDSWAIFTPIITLSLGYMFGKKENSDDKNINDNDVNSKDKNV